MKDSNCVGCDGYEAHTTDGCCNLAKADDGMPARCVGDWSRDKHFYLDRYASIFTKGMKKKWPKLVFVDMFAGPGRCRVRPAGDFVDGSPLIAHGKGFTHTYYVDMSAQCVAWLKKRMEGRPGPCVKVREGDANLLAPTVHDDVQGLGDDALGFAFIDPPGIEIDFDSLRRLTDGLRLDLLINFPLGMNIKRQYKHQLDSIDARLDAYFGTREWRELCEPPGYDVGQRLLNLYEAQLRTLGYAYVGDEQIIKNRRRNQALYILVFASRHQRGEEFWHKVTRVEPDGQTSLFR